MADIGTLRKTDGTYTSTEKETLDELLEKLIPDKPNADEYDIRDFLTEENDKMTEEVLCKIVNDTTVKEAVKQFDPFKSPGIDGIYPALLEKGIDTLLPYLVHIFKLSLCNGKLASH